MTNHEKHLHPKMAAGEGYRLPDFQTGPVLFVAKTLKGTDHYESKISGVLTLILVTAGL
jgi:hypothetical protein